MIELDSSSASKALCDGVDMSQTMKKLMEKILEETNKNQEVVRGRSRLRYAASELAADITAIVGDVNFYLHKLEEQCKAPITSLKLRGASL
ncbi:hypothetical protein CCACVL1_29683 [Corchorus capsularis]|uniref:Uncharacterized protein n=1 Tax=Corchorus capsularis TaxID=210143 RepID=A0A1R3G0K4_COCAP|nr:hypothetical protein CCACVL1_29683 [Corchorus capsularis]